MVPVIKISLVISVYFYGKGEHQGHQKKVLRGETLNIRIGHLKIIDHLLLGISAFRCHPPGDRLHHSTLEGVPLNSWEQLCEGLRQGALHGAFITLPLAMDLFAAGLDISLLMFVHRSGSLMVKSRNAQIKSLADLKGKSILIPHRLSVQHLLLHKLLTAAGLNQGPRNACETAAEKIFVESTSPFLMPQMLEKDHDHDIGAYIVPEPYASQAIVKNDADRLCSSDSLWKNHPGCGFVVQKKLEATHGRALEELVSHFFQSAHLLDTQIQPPSIEDTLLDAAQNFLDQEERVVRQALLHSQINYSPEKLVPDLEKLDIIQTYMTGTMGVMSQTIDLDTFVNPALANKALSEISP
jgi:NitT/TauT family transport system substrate-binding protein